MQHDIVYIYSALQDNCLVQWMGIIIDNGS